jgi:hypothetical protein
MNWRDSAPDRPEMDARKSVDRIEAARQHTSIPAEPHTNSHTPPLTSQPPPWSIHPLTVEFITVV